ncbi:MAG TPA: LysR substrate-binding domain-containing protein [Gryllotalpicola sp.]
MKLQQLEYVLEIVKQGFHISGAASSLYTSQPSVSRQLQQFEEELGFAIFERSRNHIEGLTPAGEIVVDIAKRIMSDVGDLASLKDDLMSSNRGTLTIATTHTVANYVLPEVIRSFITAYPEVQVELIQSDPEGICVLVDEGRADLAIGTDSLNSHPRLVELPCFTLDRVVVVPDGHPLLEKAEIALEDVARYPIITYDHHFSGYWKVRAAFEAAGLEPKVALSAIDAGVCKTYVSAGLGIAVLTSVTFDAERDSGLHAIPASHIFASSTTCIKIRANTYLRPYLLDFVQRVSPRLKPEVVREIVQRRPEPSDHAASLPAQQAARRR